MNLKKCLKFAVLIICLASIPFGFSACTSSSSQQATSQQKVHTVYHPGFNLNTDTDPSGAELDPDIKAAAKKAGFLCSLFEPTQDEGFLNKSVDPAGNVILTLNLKLKPPEPQQVNPPQSPTPLFNCENLVAVIAHHPSRASSHLGNMLHRAKLTVQNSNIAEKNLVATFNLKPEEFEKMLNLVNMIKHGVKDSNGKVKYPNDDLVVDIYETQNDEIKPLYLKGHFEINKDPIFD